MTTAWNDDYFVAGDVALDFANTVFRRTPVLGADLLAGADDLTAWLDRAGLLPPGDGLDDLDGLGDFDDSEAALREARTLRDLFWAIFDAQVAGRELPSGALAGLLDLARRGLDGDVSVGPDGSVSPTRAWGAFAVLALRGLKLALSPSPHPLRACDRCGWYFLDTSRGRRRRWCSMKTCGNQAKAARHRSTQL